MKKSKDIKQNSILTNERLILVEWEDAAKYTNNTYTKEAALKNCTPMLIVTIGILVEETPESYLLASDLNMDNKKFRDIMTIPKTCVKRITLLHYNELVES